jgi:flagellar M-ring protein FliF
MPGNRPNFVSQLFEMWARLQWPQRLTIIFFAVFGLASIGTVVYFMNRVEYQVLCRDLNPEDASAVAAKLEEKKIAYGLQPTAQGTTIKVAAPQEVIEKLRLDISGIGRNVKPGYDSILNNSMFATDEIEQAKLQRALEGDLERTISSLSEISRARVNIVIRKNSYFQENKEDSKASVVLTLKKGAELSKSSVSGIKQIVANTVPGLRARYVAITDEEGNPLAKSAESGDEASADTESGIRENLEKEISGKVVSTLEPMVGKGKVHATASVELDLSSTDSQEETYIPNQTVVRSQRKNEERIGNSPSVSGIPGTSSNLGNTGPQASLSNSDRERKSESIDNEVSRKISHTIQPKGTVRKLTVAVVLDHKSVWNKGDDGKVTSHAEPRSAQDLSAYRDLVLAAVGYDEERGDKVEVKNFPYYTDTKPEEPAPAIAWYNRAPIQTYLLPAIKYASFIILFFAVYLLFIRPMRKRVFQALSMVTPELSESGQAVLTSGDIPLELNEAVQPEQIAVPVTAPATSLPAGERNLLEDLISMETASDEQIERELMLEAGSVDMGNRKFTAMKKKLAEKAKKDPEMISQLIRNLLREKA